MSSLLVGTMSGTSMDGIDVALIESDGELHIKAISHHHLAYPPAFQVLLKALEFSMHLHAGDVQAARRSYRQDLRRYLNRQHHLSPEDIDQQMRQLFRAFHKDPSRAVTVDDLISRSTEWHGHAIETLLENSHTDHRDVRVVGYHGQTLYHNPKQRISYQMGDGQLLADRLAIPVVTRFREQDVHHGGQGAPLAPLYHQALVLRDIKQKALPFPIAVINCGGIANATLIRSQQLGDVIGFDTGPGNVLIDRFIQQHCTGDTMDKDGSYGLQGKVHRPSLDILYHRTCNKGTQNYYDLTGPKSLDSNDLVLIPELDNLPFVDACATLEAFTAATIVSGVLRASEGDEPKLWVLAGGGWKNPVIKASLERYVKECQADPGEVKMADELAWDSESIEAEMFAYYALRNLQNKPISYPCMTRVTKPMVGGTCYAPRKARI